MKSEDLLHWSDAYISAQELKVKDIDHPLWWAVRRFFDVMPDCPDACWAAILVILDRTSNAKVLEILGAGPLEMLIHQHGPRFIERIEFEAREDPSFKSLLCYVWECSTEEVWIRVQKARGGR